MFGHYPSMVAILLLIIYYTYVLGIVYYLLSYPRAGGVSTTEDSLQFGLLGEIFATLGTEHHRSVLSSAASG